MIREKDFLKEKELLLNSIEQNTKEHWKNYYKDVPIECIYDDLVIDINEIKRLQNNWNELKKWLEEETKQYWNTDILEKMQELENKKVSSNIVYHSNIKKINILIDHFKKELGWK